jgi:hypothetical protein
MKLLIIYIGILLINNLSNSAYSLLLDPNLTIILVLHNPPYNLKEQVSQVTGIYLEKLLLIL